MNHDPRHNGQQQPLSLYTREGEFVAAVKTPRFTEPPEVVVYGVRTFVRRKYTDPRIAPSYYEAFAWTAPLQGGSTTP